MKIAITGATGFIGKYLVNRHLDLGDEVRVLTRKTTNIFAEKVDVFNHDLLGDEKYLIDFVIGVDILYHCAAEIKDESRMFEVNVKGTANLIDAAKGRIKHWIQLSSTGVYGPVFSGLVDESQELNPMNSYEKSKVESDELVIAAGLNDFFNFTILRPSNVFGAQMINQSLFQLVRAVDKGLFFFIGKGGGNANYIPVENVVEAMILIGRNSDSYGKIFNISDYLPLIEFVGLIAGFLNRPTPKTSVPYLLMKILGFLGDVIPKSPLTSGRINALTNKVIYSNAFIIKELGYKPAISLASGVKSLVDKYLQDK